MVWLLAESIRQQVVSQVHLVVMDGSGRKAYTTAQSS